MEPTHGVIHVYQYTKQRPDRVRSQTPSACIEDGWLYPQHEGSHPTQMSLEAVVAGRCCGVRASRGDEHAWICINHLVEKLPDHVLTAGVARLKSATASEEVMARRGARSLVSRSGGSDGPGKANDCFPSQIVSGGECRVEAAGCNTPAQALCHRLSFLWG